MTVSGSPPPNVEWWRDDILIDSTLIDFPERKANQLIIQNLQRHNRGATYECRASNTNLIPAVSSSITIDMYRKYFYETIVY